MIKIAIRYYGMGRDFRVKDGGNFTNGEVRMRVFDGSSKGVYKWVFAGNTHEAFQSGILRNMAAMRLGNFDGFIQAARGGKFERFRRDRNAFKEGKEDE